MAICCRTHAKTRRQPIARYCCYRSAPLCDFQHFAREVLDFMCLGGLEIRLPFETLLVFGLRRSKKMRVSHGASRMFMRLARPRLLSVRSILYFFACPSLKTKHLAPSVCDFSSCDAWKTWPSLEAFLLRKRREQRKLASRARHLLFLELRES